MRIVYENLAGDGGAVASYKVLLHSLAVNYPQDEYTIICLESSAFHGLNRLPNVRTIAIPKGELSRLYTNTIHITRIAKEAEADVIWSSNAGPYVRTGVPQVLNVVNAFQVYPWSMVRYHPHTKLSVAVLRWFFRLTLKNCDAVLVETPLMGEYVRRVPNAPLRIEAIPKAVETLSDFEPRPMSTAICRWFDSGLGRSAFTFLYVATRSPHKNHTTAFAAIDLLRSQGIAARLALSLDEKQSLAAYCDSRLVSSLIQSGHVLPLGWVGKEELAAVYQASDACVMPSVLESMSSAHLEAMHWQKPQIAADLPYSHDLCGDAAVYAVAEDPADWAAKMRRMMNDAALREALVKAGVERMKDYPQTWQDVARRVRCFLVEVSERRQ